LGTVMGVALATEAPRMKTDAVRWAKSFRSKRDRKFIRF
jgi:hypothetical protein